jgi:hypothetical protein
MMKTFVLTILTAVALLAGGGCWPLSRPSDRSTTTQPDSPAPIKESQQVKAFKEKARQYLEESRAGVKLLRSGPSLAQARAKATLVKDLYSHVPDVPPEIDRTGGLADALKAIDVAFYNATLSVELCLMADRAYKDAEYTLGWSEKKEMYATRVREAYDGLNKTIASIEALIGLVEAKL